MVVTHSGYTSRNGYSRSSAEALDEASAAGHVLGVRTVVAPREPLILEPTYELIDDIEKFVDGADLVITHHPNDPHQDHEAVAVAAETAARNCSEVWWMPAPPWRHAKLTNPDLYVELETQDVANRRVALRCYKTVLDARPDMVQAVERQSQSWGDRCGPEHQAEAFAIGKRIWRLTDDYQDHPWGYVVEEEDR